MPSSEHFAVKGQSPYKQKNGVFEVEFAITEARPTEEQISQKSFLPIWREKTHLNIIKYFHQSYSSLISFSNSGNMLPKLSSLMLSIESLYLKNSGIKNLYF